MWESYTHKKTQKRSVASRGNRTCVRPTTLAEHLPLSIHARSHAGRWCGNLHVRHVWHKSAQPWCKGRHFAAEARAPAAACTLYHEPLACLATHNALADLFSQLSFTNAGTDGCILIVIVLREESLRQPEAARSCVCTPAASAQEQARERCLFGR